MREGQSFHRVGRETLKFVLICLAVTLAAAPALALPACDSGPRINCVVDGDAVWLGGEKIRLFDIDAPELLSPKCPQEALWAAEARDRLADLLVGEVEVRREGKTATSARWRSS